MIDFILNNQNISTDLAAGITVLDFVRYRQNLKGTKIGCREGDCGACTILVGELQGDQVSYRTMTSCIMPLANAVGKHIVTVEGINPDNGGLTPVQQAMVDESGTQCGFCTVGFVMSLTAFCIDETEKTSEMAVSAIDGNICRCTGYKSIERAAMALSESSAVADGLMRSIEKRIVPEYFANMSERLEKIKEPDIEFSRPLTQAVLTQFVGGGTDVYVQKPDAMAESGASHLFYDNNLRGIRDLGDFVEIGASVTVTDLLVSPVMQSIFPDLYKHLKLVSSTPIRNMATLAGNFVNASPIGDMTVWFLALDASIMLTGAQGSLLASPRSGEIVRELPLSDLYLGYKQLAKTEGEIITTIRFKKPGSLFRFNFEKVCKRTYLDIATVNTAISLQLADTGPPVPAILRSKIEAQKPKIDFAHVSAGGVAPIPLYLRNTSEYLNGKEVSEETIANAIVIMQDEISPISDVRGTEAYKRLLLNQLFKAHFVELFDYED